MKIIGITGKGGYVSTNLSNFLIEKGYKVVIIDLFNKNWDIVYSFKGIDVIVHTAGLVHKEEKRTPYSLYEEINTNLTSLVAEKAKNEGVSQFIFMSSEAVYGVKPKVTKTTIINEKTSLKPITKYGFSKLRAENILLKLASKDFNVLILRCPIIIGKKCPGNYSKLRQFVLKYRLFPKINNKKSMLYIGTLCSFIEHSIFLGLSGIFLPQDSFYYCTKDIAKKIGVYNRKTVLLSSFLGLFIFVVSIFLTKLRKPFASSIIDQKMSIFDDGYCYNNKTFNEIMCEIEKL